MEHDYISMMKQIYGKGDLFGYTRRLLNQAHLMYWFLGEFYHTKVFSKFITRFWILFNIYSFIALNVHCLLYIFLTSEPQQAYILFATEVIVSSIYLLIMTPLGSYIHRGCINQTFEVFDSSYDLKLFATTRLPYAPRIEPFTGKKYPLKIPVTILQAQIFIFFAYIAFTYFDLVIEYSPSKLSNPKFSVFPLYCEKIDRLSTFLMLLFTQMITGISMGALYFSIPFFTFVVMREFYCKFQMLSDFLDKRGKLFEYYYEEFTHKKYHSSKEVIALQEAFLQDIHAAAEFHHYLFRGIAHLRPYLEYNMSISLFTSTYIEVILIYIFTLMGEESMLLKLKILSHSIMTGTIFFTYCITGKLYSDMCDMFRESVNNLPWYYLPPSRRISFHLLLHQSQVTIEFRAFGIYILNMEFFLRLCNTIYSTVNLLRRNAIGFGF